MVTSGVLASLRVVASRGGARHRIWIEQASIDRQLNDQVLTAQPHPDTKEAANTASTTHDDESALSRDRDRWRVEALRHREANRLLLLAFDELQEANQHLEAASRYQREAIGEFVNPGDIAED